MNNVISEIRFSYDSIYQDNTLTCLIVSGKDCRKFLQGQLTNDIEQLSHKQISASYCTHQGKVITNIRVFASGDDIVLLLPKILSNYFVEKISKYILMSDVKFTEYEDSTILWMIDEKAKEFLNKYEINEIQSFKKISDDVFIINMSNQKFNQCRYIDLKSKNYENIDFNKLDDNQTCLLDILSMHTRLKKDDIEKFIPQVLNSDQLKTVNYKKGCYTGQEVIARTHYLGNVKKHAYLVHVDASTKNQKSITTKDGESIGELIGETFVCGNTALSHCILRDSADFNDLYLDHKKIQVVTMEDTV